MANRREFTMPSLPTLAETSPAHRAALANRARLERDLAALLEAETGHLRALDRGDRTIASNTPDDGMARAILAGGKITFAGTETARIEDTQEKLREIRGTIRAHRRALDLADLDIERTGRVAAVALFEKVRCEHARLTRGYADALATLVEAAAALAALEAKLWRASPGWSYPAPPVDPLAALENPDVDVASWINRQLELVANADPTPKLSTSNILKRVLR